MLLEPECQCVALIAATVKLGQKLDNQPFKSCFQILKARLVLPIMPFSRVGKMTKNDTKITNSPESFGTLPRTPLTAVSETTRPLSRAQPHS